MEQQQTDKPAATEQQANRMSTADLAAGAAGRARDDSQSARSREEQAAGTTRGAPLLPKDYVEELRSQWTDIQAGFVDRPRESVEGADTLVAGVMQRLAETFANERSGLEAQWSRGGDASTEDLRLALQHYRSFFDRLLTL